MKRACSPNIGRRIPWTIFLEEINEAYRAIEPLKMSDAALYKTLYDRINRESIAYRYLLIQLYPGSFTRNELFLAKRQFRADCEELAISRFNEHNDISSLWGEWGIA